MNKLDAYQARQEHARTLLESVLCASSVFLTSCISSRVFLQVFSTPLRQASAFGARVYSNNRLFVLCVLRLKKIKKKQ